MADKKITDFPEISSIGANDVFLVGGTNATYKAKVDAVRNSMNTATTSAKGLMSVADKAKLDNDLDFKVINLFAAWQIDIDLGFDPTSGKYGQYLFFNANQNALVSGKVEPSAATEQAKYEMHIMSGALTYTTALNGSVLTITPSGRLWGVTTVIYVHN